MISCVVIFDGHVITIFYGETQQSLLRSCVKFGQTAVVVLKNLFQN